MEGGGGERERLQGVEISVGGGVAIVVGGEGGVVEGVAWVGGGEGRGGRQQVCGGGDETR